MKINWKQFIVSVGIPLLVGGLAALLTREATADFAMLAKPPFSPPAWVFPVVWTVLYLLMGISSYLIWVSDAKEEEKNRALQTYFYQLVVNFLWPIFFFNFKWYFFSFFWILLLWYLVWKMIKEFSGISKLAGKLNFPYIVWLTIAAYLNLGVWWLNR